MRSIVARGVSLGMAVAYMASAEQRAIENVVSVDVSHSVIQRAFQGAPATIR